MRQIAALFYACFAFGVEASNAAAGDSAGEMHELQARADTGDTTAIYNLGVAFSNGDGVHRDVAQSEKWFRKGSELGDPWCQEALGELYDQGDGLKPNASEALKWYHKAADQGNTTALYNLGRMYRKGRGVEADNDAAAYWFRKGAELGYVPAEVDLGYMYASGIGVAKDEVEGLAWIYIAAASGDKIALKYQKIVEARLGRDWSLVAQQRSTVLSKAIEAKKESGQ